jgi:hypothetical protein
MEKVPIAHHFAVFGPFTLTQNNYPAGKYQQLAPNFGQVWRAARLYFLTDGAAIVQDLLQPEQKLQVGTRNAAVTVGWHQHVLETSGASVLQVDFAVERTGLAALLEALPFAVWHDAALASATGAALEALASRPSQNDLVRHHTENVIEALLSSLLRLSPTV